MKRSDKTISAEFTDLGLEGTRCGVDPVHCEYHAHIIHGTRDELTTLGIALLLVGVSFVASNVLVGLVLLAAGTGVIMLGSRLNQKWTAELTQLRPHLPLVARFERIRIQEDLKGEITLTPEGRYHSNVSRARGNLTVASRFGAFERETLKRYRRKHRLASNDPVSFHLGFIALRGAVAMELEAESLPSSCGHGVISLTGEIASHPFLGEGLDSASRKWEGSVNYRLRAPRSIEEVPIWLVPSLVPEQQARALELEVDWAALNLSGEQSGVHHFKSLTLEIPAGWGKVELTRPLAQRSSSDFQADEPIRMVTWRRISIPPSERQERRSTFFVRFERRIDCSEIIRGRIELSANGSLSGIDGVGAYYPLGTRRGSEGRTQIETSVEVRFELNLRHLRHQGLKLASDDRCTSHSYRGVIPDHEIIIKLTDELSREGFYVKRVIENPPRQAGRAGTISRLWDIAGRHYTGVHPIDFHLVVTGEVPYEGPVDGASGNLGWTKFDLRVQGTYANPDMEELIDSTCGRLGSLVSKTLEQVRDAGSKVVR